jgi:hypothetical protein
VPARICCRFALGQQSGGALRFFFVKMLKRHYMLENIPLHFR